MLEKKNEYPQHILKAINQLEVLAYSEIYYSCAEAAKYLCEWLKDLYEENTKVTADLASLSLDYAELENMYQQGCVEQQSLMESEG